MSSPLPLNQHIDHLSLKIHPTLKFSVLFL
jgi:hypothetical protein